MSVGKTSPVLALMPKAPAPAPMPAVRVPFSFDAALGGEGPSSYVPTQPFAWAMSSWSAIIEAQRLSDVTVGSLHALSVDYRDGALCRDAGGTCYTPHAWSQLVALMKAQGAPAGTANVLRWLAPLARHHGWSDVVRTSQRPRTEEGVLRMFYARTPDGSTHPTVRAVVSGRHSLKHFDDAAVLGVVAALDEKPVTARISRGWDETHATFDLDAGDSDVALSFYMRNSETGCASLSFSAALRLSVLDTNVVMPSGERYDRIVRLATEAGASRRRHTLPRFSGSSGSRFSEATRGHIASRRIAADIESALGGSRVLAEKWSAARKQINPLLVPVAKASAVTDSAVGVLQDVLAEMGVLLGESKEEITAFAMEVATVMANDSRLKSLPHGSLAHLAAALAVLAVQQREGKAPSWEHALALQRLSGQVLMSVAS